MKFLVDDQLPPALVRYLRQLGFNSERVLEIGLDKSSDIQICRHAEEHEFIIVSKDEDFFYLANQPNINIRFVWVQLGNCRTSALLAAFDRLWSAIEFALSAGDRIVEIR